MTGHSQRPYAAHVTSQRTASQTQAKGIKFEGTGWIGFIDIEVPLSMSMIGLSQFRLGFYTTIGHHTSLGKASPLFLVFSNFCYWKQMILQQEADRLESSCLVVKNFLRKLCHSCHQQTTPCCMEWYTNYIIIFISFDSWYTPEK